MSTTLSNIKVHFHLAHLALNATALRGVKTAQDITQTRLKYLHQSGMFVTTDSGCGQYSYSR
jgi:hypothetical protein